VVSTAVATLTEETLTMMLPIKWPGIVGAVLAMGVLAAGVGVLVSRTPGAPPADAQAGKVAKRAPAASNKDGVK
jgi:hypothetical protein